MVGGWLVCVCVFAGGWQRVLFGMAVRDGGGRVTLSHPRAVGGCHRLVQPDGAAQPAGKVHLLRLALLNEGMDLLTRAGEGRGQRAEEGISATVRSAAPKHPAPSSMHVSVGTWVCG